MADDVTVDNVSLTDYKVVADEITSPYAGTAGLAQGVKILDGTANGTQPVPATTANGLLVDVSRITGTVTVDTGILQYAEDTAHVGGDKLMLAGVLQQAADAAISGDFDRTLLQVDSSGFLKVNVKAGSAGGTQYTEGDVDATITGPAIMWEDAANTLRAVSLTKPLPVTLFPAGLNAGPVFGDDTTFTIAADAVMAIGAMADESFTDSVNEDDIGIPRMTLDRKLLVRVVGATDANRLDIDASGRPTVNVNGTVTVDSELPAAAALADNMANPTVPGVGAFGMVFDGSTWDRMIGTSAEGVCVSGAKGVDTAPGSLPVSMAGVGSTATPSPTSADNRLQYLWLTRNGALNVADGGGSLTVDGTVTANQGTAGTAWEVVGDVAADVGVPANPVSVGGRASNAVPTAVSADADSVFLWLLRTGALVVAQAAHHGMLSDPYNFTSKTVQTTTTQTGSDVWTPASGKKIIVTSYQIQAGGTTAGTIQLWFGANADTTYSRGTDLAIFDGEFAPSATLKPGAIQTGLWISSTADHEVHLTTSAAINPLTITLWGYEV